MTTCNYFYSCFLHAIKVRVFPVLLQMLGAYSVSKTALLGLTKALAEELAGDNIRVNCLAPGLIKTSFSAAVSTLRRLSSKHLTISYVWP